MRLAQNFRFALRMMVRRPGFTLLVVFYFGLAIGANSAIFSVVDGLLGRPLPFRSAEELVLVWNTFSGPGGEQEEYPVSPANFLEWKEGNEVFTDLAAMDPTSLNLTSLEEPLRIETAAVTANTFSVLGIEALHGRTFVPSEDLPGASPVVVLSHDLWQRSFGGDTAVVGSDIELDGRQVRVVGVMPPEMRFPEEAEIWVPLGLDPAALPPWHYLLTLGRLADGVTLEQAEAHMATVSRRLAQEYPESNEGWGTTVSPLREKLVGDLERDLKLLFGAVVLVLAIACANVSSLYMARLAQRRRELAVRSALGGLRGQLIAQLLAESTALSVLGGAVGLLLGYLALPPILAVSDLEIPSYMSPELDLRVVFFTLLVTVATGIVFGLIPALSLFRTELSPYLREGTRSVLGARNQLMNALVVVEVALAVMLLCGAGLLFRSLQELQSVDPGFDREELLSMRLTLPDSPYTEPADRADFFERALDELAAVPGVRGAALTTTLPLSRNNLSGTFTVEGYEYDDDDQQRMANSRMVSPGYFRTLGTPMLQGRDFSSLDRADSPEVVIISREMARRYFPDQDPIGKRVKRGRADSVSPWLEVVGVVGDVHDAGLGEDVGATWYMPYAQNSWGTAYLVVRTAAAPETLIPRVREAIWRVDSNQPIYEVATVEEVVERSIAQPRFQTFLFALFAGVALLLATVGIYGVISFATAERTQEFGLRMALGSTRRQILGLVLGHGVLLSGIGLAIGLAASYLLGGRLAASLYQVDPRDLGILAVVAFFLFLVAVAATFIPAFRATRVTPITALRWE